MVNSPNFHGIYCAFYTVLTVQYTKGPAPEGGTRKWNKEPKWNKAPEPGVEQGEQDRRATFHPGTSKKANKIKAF
jgi:hypothetical protein